MLLRKFTRLAGPNTGVADPPSANRILWCRKSTGQTTTQWDDQSGNANHIALTNAPTLNGDGSIGFNGTDETGSAAFALVNPCTVYLRVRIDTWADGSVICDAQAGGNRFFQMNTATPQVRVNNGVALGPFGGMTVSSYDSIGLVFDAASSNVRINATDNSGDSGGGNSDSGITIGSIRGNSLNSAVSIKEVICYNVAHTGTTLSDVIAYLNAL